MVGALEDLRVLDLTDPSGQYCGKLLADLGAHVIKVEPPGGDPSRREGPFLHDESHPEKSLSFFYRNTSKRGITLNLEHAEGRALFRRLATTADIVLETSPSGYLASLEVGYPQLRVLNPRIIWTSITGFGQWGPHASYRSSDLIAQAMGGRAFVVGLPEARPTQMAGEQAYSMASVHATVGALMAVYARERTGEGQQVDVSMQECVAMSLEWTVQYYDVLKVIHDRPGVIPSAMRRQPMPAAGLFRCKDGYVQFGAFRQWDGLVAWMTEEGMQGDLTDPTYQDQETRGKEIAHVNGLVQAFLLTHTREEVTVKGQALGMTVSPFNRPEELLTHPQLVDRGYFVQVEHPELGAELTYPRGPYLLSETPSRISRRAPGVGEHNQEVYCGELGLSHRELEGFMRAGVI